MLLGRARFEKSNYDRHATKLPPNSNPEWNPHSASLGPWLPSTLQGILQGRLGWPLQFRRHQESYLWSYLWRRAGTSCSTSQCCIQLGKAEWRSIRSDWSRKSTTENTSRSHAAGPGDTTAGQRSKHRSSISFFDKFFPDKHFPTWAKSEWHQRRLSGRQAWEVTATTPAADDFNFRSCVFHTEG